MGVQVRLVSFHEYNEEVNENKDELPLIFIPCSHERHGVVPYRTKKELAESFDSHIVETNIFSDELSKFKGLAQCETSYSAEWVNARGEPMMGTKPESYQPDSKTYCIRMFGLDEAGKTYCIKVQDFHPRFYCMVPDYWRKKDCSGLMNHLQEKLGAYYKDGLLKIILQKRKKLNGFDGQREHLFAKLIFANVTVMNKIKNSLWYGSEVVPPGETPGKYDKFKNGKHYRQKLHAGGYLYNNRLRDREERLPIYEANIPPLLRYFHIHDISPSGWIELSDDMRRRFGARETSCDFEFAGEMSQIVALPDKETLVPYNICSFDIEASSSHGDFPQPKKDYKKLAQDILEEFDKYRITSECRDEVDKQTMLSRCLMAAFGYESLSLVDIVYPKQDMSEEQVQAQFQLLLCTPMEEYENTVDIDEIEYPELETDIVCDRAGDCENHVVPHDDPSFRKKRRVVAEYDKGSTVVNMIWDMDFPKESKINELRKALNSVLPPLKGDTTTFIGSTFRRHGEDKPHRQHILVLGGCDDLPNIEVHRCATERDLLVEWTRLIQEENPDIITGYNIFGFDDPFLFHRAAETGCLTEFLELTRIRGQSSGVMNWKKKELELVQKTVFLASGEHNLNYFNMIGRLQIDLYNLFRRDYNLDSYKLDSVSAHFIGGMVSGIDPGHSTTVHSPNLQGLEQGNYVVFEEIGHSSSYYQKGKKYMVESIDHERGCFQIGRSISPDMRKKVKWCLLKDDVDHVEIFKLSKGSNKDRAKIAKYCIQDCNLVHHLMKKIDIMTGFVEMSNICSVPMEFLVLRGQGIKLTSFIAKKCKEKNILMPVLPKGKMDEGYEGAIVLAPKCE